MAQYTQIITKPVTSPSRLSFDPFFYTAGHTQGVTSVRIGRDGTECETLVASSSYDCTLRLWCSVAGECIAILK